MSIFKTIATAAVAMCALASAASAQNYDGNGRLRFGAFLQGYTMPADESQPTSGSGNLGGYGVGATFGYDWSLHNGWIIGAEADGVATDAGQNINGSKYNIDYMATFRGRLGYNIDRNWLIYGTTGVALNGIHYRGPTTASTSGSTLKVSATLPGWTIGLGAEWRYYDTILFGEYLYANFENWDFTGGFNTNHSLDTDAHMFRVGVKWIYGHDYYVDDVKRRY
jgi:Outer membrane protein beta-barrel domain